MTIDDFMPFVLVDVGCSDPLAHMHLRRTIQEFCRITNIWNEVQDAIPLVDGESNYEIDTLGGADVNNVLAAWVSGLPIYAKSLAQIQMEMPSWMTMATNRPIYYNMVTDKSSVDVYPTPINAQSAPLVLRVSYVPQHHAKTYPDFLGDIYMDAITSGAKARLMAIPSQDWSNPTLAAFHQDQFMQGAFKAKAALAHENVPSSIYVQARRFGF